MKGSLLAGVWRDVIVDHHDAFIVEFFGSQNSGLSVERIQELLSRGLIDPAKMSGVKIEGMDNEVDPFEFMMGVSDSIEAPDADVDAMRDWGIDDWKKAVDKTIDERWAAAAVQPELEIGGYQIELPKPAGAAVQVVPGVPVHPDVPGWLSPMKQNTWTQAIERAGDFCRGLGNRNAAQLENTLAEVWDGEDIVTEMDAGKRARELKIVRERVADAVETGKDEWQLARDLANDTGRWSHDWLRIAKTELQGCYNEGKVIHAIETYGEEARVARIAETGACEHCRRLFDGPEGPNTFDVETLISNGTNVGRRADSWLATIWPVHPNCRCDTVIVPPGMKIIAGGALRRAA